MHSSTLHFNHRERFCKRQTLSWAGRAHKNWDPETPRFWKLPKTGWWYASIIDSETRNLRLRPKWINVVIGRPRECEERDHYGSLQDARSKGCKRMYLKSKKLILKFKRDIGWRWTQLTRNRFWRVLKCIPDAQSLDLLPWQNKSRIRKQSLK